MKIKDQTIKRAMALRLAGRPRGACPEDDELAAYIDGAIAEPAREELISHLARCRDCRGAVLIARRLAGKKELEAEAAIRVPIRALERAAALAPARAGLVEVVVQFAKGAAQVLKLTGVAAVGSAPAPAAARGSGAPAAACGAGAVVSATLVTFTKEFGPYRAEVELERVKPELGEITVKLTELAGGQPVLGARVSLFEADAELESAMFQEGTAVFENVKFGAYRMDITRVGAPVGRIALEMKGE